MSHEEPIPDLPRRFLPPTWVSEAFLGLLIIAGGFAPLPDGGTSGPGSATVTMLTGGALALSMPLRRRVPFVILGFSLIAAVLAPLWTNSSLGYLIAAAVVVYRITVVRSRRTGVVVSLITIVFLASGSAIAGTVGWQYVHILQSTAFVAVAAAIGDATRNRRAYIDAIVERAERAERTRELEAERRVTEERLRIARELHDAAAHQIAAINLHAGVASNALPDRPGDAQQALEVIRTSARSVLSEISTLLRVLRSAPERSDSVVAAPVLGLAALETLLADFARSGLRTEMSVAGDPSILPSTISITAYKIIQEGMANALKHSADAHAHVSISIAGREVSVQIVNRVGAATPDARLGSGQHGLIGIRERTEAVRGELSIQKTDNTFALTAVLPFAPRLESGKSRP